jgi:hypothetical protein
VCSQAVPGFGSQILKFISIIALLKASHPSFISISIPIETMLHLLQQTLSTFFHFLTANYFQQTARPSLDSRAMKKIVILGGSYAGISTAHRLLRRAGKTGNCKVILVTPNTHLYWSLASARGLVPGQLSDEQLFRPIADGFKQYPVCTSIFIVLLCRADLAVV